jgi:hypothetical protein
MLVEAETETEALERVARHLNDDHSKPDWSDWHMADESAIDEGFAGRWQGAYFGEPEEGKVSRDVLRYIDNSALAEEVIEQFKEARLNNFRRAKEEVEKIELTLLDLEPDTGVAPVSNWSEGFALISFAKTISGYWTPDSGFFDVTSDSASLRYFRERLAKDIDKQWLVVVDFHF